MPKIRLIGATTTKMFKEAAEELIKGLGGAEAVKRRIEEWSKVGKDS